MDTIFSHFSEVSVNVELARALSEHGLSASGETRVIIPTEEISDIQRARQRKPDILILFNGVRIVLEGRKGDNVNRATLEKDCLKRIEEGIADISIAVLYRDEACESRYTQATVERYIRSTRFQAKIYYVAREEKTFFPEIKHSDWQELSLDDLYKLIYSSYSLLISYDFIERVVNYMYEKINEISGILTGSDRLTKIIPQLERTISLPQSKTKLEHELRVVKISVLALLNALICHDILASYLKKPNLRKVKEYPDQRDQIIKIWDEILQEDYQPIFKVSLEILKLLPNDGNTKEGIDKLLNSAIHLSHSWSILRHDLMGRIYHFLLMRDIAKYYATYYTSITSATLLSYLVVSLTNEAWKSYRWFDLSDLSKFRAVDFACGSGTLLVSLYKSLMYKYLTESFKKNVESSLKDFHQVAIEKMIRGYDVLEYAVHLSATALTLLNPQCQYRDHHLITLPLGKLNGVFKLGSINLLMDLINLAYRKDEIEKFDVVIMNPPFTRSTGTVNLLFGDLPPEDRAPMQAELRRMLNTIDLTGIGQGGLGAIFAGMSLDVLKEGGRIGLVLPRSFLSGVSWEGVRKKMIEKCVIEVIVTSFEAPNQWNFSENTDLSEVLVVARRKLNGESMENKKCLVVNFWKKPQNDWEATSIALKLVELFDTVTVSNGHNVLELGPARPIPLRYGISESDQIGEAYGVSQTLLNRLLPSWGQIAPFAQSELSYIAVQLIKENILMHGFRKHRLPLPLKPIGVENIGPDRRQISNAFQAKPVEQFEEGRILRWGLWGYDERLNKIATDPNVRLEPKSGQMSSALALWEKASRLMVIESLWLTTYPLLSFYVSRLSLGNVFWEVKLSDCMTRDKVIVGANDVEKIACLWLNSTPGLLTILCMRQDTRGPWIRIKKRPLGMIPILDVSQLNKVQVDNLLALFEEIKDHPWPRLLSQLFDSINNCGVRYELDRKMFNILTEEEVDLQVIYQLLAKEPIITLKPLS